MQWSKGLDQLYDEEIQYFQIFQLPTFRDTLHKWIKMLQASRISLKIPQIHQNATV